MKRYVKKILQENVKVQTVFTGKQWSSCFKTKGRTKFEHQHNLIYQLKCSAENCSDDYIGESARCIIERVKDHGERDTKSHVLKHSSEKEHVEVTQEDFKIIGSHFKSNRLKSKIAEAILIKHERASLNAQDQSVSWAKIGQLMSLKWYYHTNSLMTTVCIMVEPVKWFALWIDW